MCEILEPFQHALYGSEVHDQDTIFFKDWYFLVSLNQGEHFMGKIWFVRWVKDGLGGSVLFVGVV